VLPGPSAEPPSRFVAALNRFADAFRSHWLAILVGILLVYSLLPFAAPVLKKLGGSTILENNIVQTIGSAGESVAGGVVFTIPALIFLVPDGPKYFNYTQITMLAFAGGILGVLMMVPLRRALIVQQHGKLKYPEGTACAEVLKAGASLESRAAASKAALAEESRGIGKALSARTIFTGFGIGLVYKALNVAFKGWKDVSGVEFAAPLKGGSVAAELSPELLGVGYIIGPRVGYGRSV